MKKPSLTAILFMIMLLTLLLFTTACSYSGDGVWVGGTDVTKGGYWRSDGEGGITSTGADETNYTVHYKYVASERMGYLTLNRATITKYKEAKFCEIGDNKLPDYYGRTAVYATYPLTINLIGENTLNGADFEITSNDYLSYSHGICIIGNNTSLTIQNNGYLEVSGGAAPYVSCGVFVAGGNVVIKDDATVIATGGSASNSYGVVVYHDFYNCSLSSGRLVAQTLAETGAKGAIYSGQTMTLPSSYYWRTGKSASYT